MSPVLSRPLVGLFCHGRPLLHALMPPLINLVSDDPLHMASEASGLGGLCVCVCVCVYVYINYYIQ